MMFREHTAIIFGEPSPKMTTTCKAIAALRVTNIFLVIPSRKLRTRLERGYQDIQLGAAINALPFCDVTVICAHSENVSMTRSSLLRKRAQVYEGYYLTERGNNVFLRDILTGVDHVMVGGQKPADLHKHCQVLLWRNILDKKAKEDASVRICAKNSKEYFPYVLVTKDTYIIVAKAIGQKLVKTVEKVASLGAKKLFFVLPSIGFLSQSETVAQLKVFFEIEKLVPNGTFQVVSASPREFRPFPSASLVRVIGDRYLAATLRGDIAYEDVGLAKTYFLVTRRKIEADDDYQIILWKDL